MQYHSSCRTSGASFAHILETLCSINCCQCSLPASGVAIYDLTAPCTIHSMCNTQLRLDYGLQFYGRKPEEWLRYTVRVKKYKHGNALTEEEFFSVIPTLHFFSCSHVCSTDLQKYSSLSNSTAPLSKIHIPLISYVKALKYSGKCTVSSDYALLAKVSFL